MVINTLVEFVVIDGDFDVGSGFDNFLGMVFGDLVEPGTTIVDIFGLIFGESVTLTFENFVGSGIGDIVGDMLSV